MDKFLVVKRNGNKESFNIEKVHRVIEWAIDGFSGVSLSDIEININLNIKNDITTKEIQDLVTESAANLISVENPNYQYVAGRLLNYQLRKDVWGGKNPPKLYNFIEGNINNGHYDPDILNWYSKEEINKIDEFTHHDRDLSFTYAGIRQLCDKYLVQNRETKQIFETPQFAYILIAACLFHNYPKDTRLLYVKKTYNYFSKHKINLPTPIMAGIRTKMRSFSSCLLVDCGDSMDSIFATLSVVGHAAAWRYGIGINMGRMRAINTPIRNGDVIHTGVIPFLKLFESSVKACHQNGIRSASATVNFPIWHLEIEDIVQLKNNAGTEENRVRKLDYSIAISKIFYERFLKNEDITLFSPHEVPGLYDKFGLDGFDELYVKYENDDKIRFKKKISARKLFSLITKERIETGRIYIFNIDHGNFHSSWDTKINMKNLCQEIDTPAVPLNDYNDPNAEIGICILSAINWLEISSDSELEKACDLAVRMLDELIDYQDYFNQACRNFATKRRSLGVGITNLAAFLAKHSFSYDDSSAIELVNGWIEKQQFYLLKSSNQLAKEKGACESFNETKYFRGVLPIDTYKKDIDEICPNKLTQDWDGLREDILKFGLRNSTVSAQMPCESSSVIASSTNGIEPIKSLITYKKSKVRTIPVLAPHVDKLKNKYDLAFNRKDNIGYLNICAVMQKYIDMGMSVNVYYNFPIKDSDVIKDMLYHYKMGGKSIYYTNTDDQNIHGIEDKLEKCSSGACSI